MSQLAFVVYAALTMPAVAAGTVGARPDVPAGAPGLAQLRKLDGTWTCTGQMQKTPFGPGHPVQGTATIGLDPAGNSYLIRYEEKQTSENTTPIVARMVWSYDAAEKKFTTGLATCLVAMCRQTSTGWDGESMVWAGDAMMDGQRVTVRDTYTLSGKSMIRKSELEAGGNRTLVHLITCNKTAP